MSRVDAPVRPFGPGRHSVGQVQTTKCLCAGDQQRLQNRLIQGQAGALEGIREQGVVS